MKKKKNIHTQDGYSPS